MVALELLDIDQLLDVTSSLDPSTSTHRIRAWRNELAHTAVLLSYARHVLSVDIGVLQSIIEDPAHDLQALVNDLPRLLATASIGGGWSLSPDSIATMDSADRVLDGEADGLLSAHSKLALIDLHSDGVVAGTITELKAQLESVTDHLELVEKRLRELQVLMVDRYKSGAASADDWIV